MSDLVKPGDLVTTNPPSCMGHEEPVIGLIVKEIANWDRRCFKVLWSNGQLLSEDSIDLQVINEAG